MTDGTCGHCGRQITTAARGWAADGTALCHTGTIPPGNEPPDCYRLVTVYQHAADGSCCFAGCGRLCRKHGEHTLKWGDCEFGQRPAPVLGYFSTFTADDGEVSGGEHEFPLTVFLWWAARLSADEQHKMLSEAAASDDPGSVIERWRRKADKSMGAATGVTINTFPASAPPPGYGPMDLQAMYEHGRRQGRYKAGG